MKNPKNRKWHGRYDVAIIGMASDEAALRCRCGNVFHHNFHGIATCDRCFSAEFMPSLVKEWEQKQEAIKQMNEEKYRGRRFAV